MCQPFNYQSKEEETKELNQDSVESLINSQKQEIHVYRNYFTKLNKILADIIKVRKSVFERKIDKKDLHESTNFFLTELKQEIFDLDMEKMAACTLPELQNNLLKFRVFMDKVDSYNFNIDLVKNIEFDPVEELEIEEIKKVSKMKEFLRNYKYMVEKQNNLIRILTRNTEIKYDPKSVSEKVSLLTIPGLEQQKKYLEDQQKLIEKSNIRFQTVQKNVDATFQKMESKRTDLMNRIQSRHSELSNNQNVDGSKQPQNQKVQREEFGFGFGAQENSMGMNVNFRDDGEDTGFGMGMGGFGDVGGVAGESSSGDKFYY